MMAYFITFCDNWQRVIPMCIIENRANIPAIKNQIGSVIQDYIDSQLALITSEVLVYRVESENCNLAGFFAIQAGAPETGAVIMQVLRPAFQGFPEIQKNINNFITENSWRFDQLTTNY